MIIKTRDYVDRHFQETKQECNDVDDVILKSALVYQYLHIRNFKKYISIDEILELYNNEIGLIGPGNVCLTHFLERILVRRLYYTHIAFYMMLMVDSMPIIH